MKFDSFQRSLLNAFAPSLAIVVLYFVFVQRPLDRTHQHELNRLEQLMKADAMHGSDVDLKRLEPVSIEIKNLEQQLSSSQAATSQLVAKRSALSGTLLGSSVPATTIAQMLEVLERNGLRCLSSQPNETPKTKLPESLLPAGRILGPQQNQPQDHCELQIVVVGTFTEMRNALRELRFSSAGVLIISLEMDLAMEDADRHTWMITTAIWETGR